MNAKGVCTKTNLLRFRSPCPAWQLPCPCQREPFSFTVGSPSDPSPIRAGCPHGARVPAGASFVPPRSVWAQAEEFSPILLVDATKLFCIKKLYLFVNTLGVNKSKDTTHIFSTCIIICKVLCWIPPPYKYLENYSNRACFSFPKRAVFIKTDSLLAQLVITKCSH